MITFQPAACQFQTGEPGVADAVGGDGGVGEEVLQGVVRGMEKAVEEAELGLGDEVVGVGFGEFSADGGADGGSGLGEESVEGVALRVSLGGQEFAEDGIGGAHPEDQL